MLFLSVLNNITFFVYPVIPNNLSSSASFSYLLYGFVTVVVGNLSFYWLFSAERIKGIKGEYEVKPDLSEFKIVKMEKSEKPEKMPEVAFCGACGKEIHNPFYCGKCGQFLCGEHYLTGGHNCREKE